MSHGDLQAAWAATIVENLSRAGVHDAVVSPGSRSTPLILALSNCGLRVTTVLDERAAGFVALGQARASGRPSVLVCTSGSALAHYWPAVVEAREAGVPLLVLSADRPPSLHQIGASQTTNQRSILAPFALGVFDLGPPSDALRSVATQVTQAVEIATRDAGPVHINAPFRKPFEPSVWPPDIADIPHGPRAYSATVSPAKAAIEACAEAIVSSGFGVIVAGPIAVGLDAEPVRRLAAATGFPLIAETTSQLRDGVSRTRGGQSLPRASAVDTLFGNATLLAQATPQVVIVLGAPPVSKWFSTFLNDHPATTVIAVTERAWPDASAAVDHMIFAPAAATCDALATALEIRADEFAGRSDEDSAAVVACAARWERADEAIWEAAFGALLDADFTEAGIVRTLSTALPDGGLFVLGNSLPVRAMDWFVPALPEHVGVVSQRGVAGIDGNIAGTIGVSIASPGRPITALMGDCTFLHDVGALQLAALALEDPVVLLVIQNDGGRIFERLPVAQLHNADAVVEDRFVMPHGRDLTAIATAFGVRAERVHDIAALHQALRRAYEATGVTVIEACVDGPTSQAVTTKLLATLNSAVTAALQDDFPVPAHAVVEDER